MKKIILISNILILILVLHSCTNTSTNTNNQTTKSEIQFKPKSTVYELIKQKYENSLSNIENYDGYFVNYLYSIDKGTILTSFKINEQIQIPNTKIELVLYSYVVGGNTIRESDYVVLDNGKYYLLNKYFSSYDDDPFNNGRGSESKKILKIKSEWTESNENIWWK